MTSVGYKTAFKGRLLIIGFGCIGQGVLPLLLRHLDLPVDRISVLAADDSGRQLARKFDICFTVSLLTPVNFPELLAQQLNQGDFLLNLAVNVSSVALIEWCQSHGVLYLDTSLEPWRNETSQASPFTAQHSIYALRETLLSLRRRNVSITTAVSGHGANPGLVTHFVKQALLNLANDLDRPVAFHSPTSQQEWSMLASDLGVTSIQIAERDTQIDRQPKRPGEFVNTWSVPAFINESRQLSELGWGTHEQALPASASCHSFGCRCAIYLNQPGALTRVQTWTPSGGPAEGYLISHCESISISDFFTFGSGEHPDYRPTVHFAYNPCSGGKTSLQELSERNWQPQASHRVINEEIISGAEELGVLIMGHSRGAYWYGSKLTIEDARASAPYNNATTLQVASAVLAGVIWAIENPNCGIVEPSEMDFERILKIAAPYLGEIIGVYTDWTPNVGRKFTVIDQLELYDPWQFRSFLLS